MIDGVFVALAAVLLVVGLMLGEVFDVWYDMTHAEASLGAETAVIAPTRPLAFGYAKLYFREVLLSPDALEHYHWGLWLATGAITVVAVWPFFAFLMVGTAASLILDENRTGLADRPFGIGKPYFAASVSVGLVLLVLLVARLISISSRFEPTVALVGFAAPFVMFGVLWIGQYFKGRSMGRNGKRLRD